MKRILAAILALSMLLCAFCAHAEESVYSICTTLEGSSSAKISNIRRAVAKINGLHIAANGTFSFNDTVGPRTKAYGFQSAENGRGVNVTGGGVAQVATTLYLALMTSGADVVYDDLRFYGSKFKDNYCAPEDAVLVDYSSEIDFAFTNFGSAMDISMWISGNELYCSLSIASDSAFSWNTRSIERTPVSTASIALSGSDALVNNIYLAAASINDTYLSAGSVFSFNDTVGPRTKANGYQTALNGRGVEVVGGGVAQVASVIWLAVRNLDGVSMLEKSTYGSRYNQSYVSSSNDAILVDYNNGTDFSFRNSGSGALTICTYIQNGYLICDIYR